MRNELEKYKQQRQEMVFRQLETRGIHDALVLAAFLKVPRHLFVSEALQDQAYGDYPLPIGEGQTISQPYMVAQMTQALKLSPSDRVLEIGTGCGYQAAILAEMVFRVYTIERIRSLCIKAREMFDLLKCHNIVTRRSDGSSGWKEHSPFEAIIVTAGAPRIPQTLVNQLRIGGRMIIPVGGQLSQELLLIEKHDYGVRTQKLGGCQFVKLTGEHGW